MFRFWRKRPVYTQAQRCTEVLREAFRSHGIKSTYDDPWMVEKNQRFRATVAPKVHEETSDHAVIEYIAIFKLPDERVYADACGGVGADFENALQDAWQKFCNGSLHVIIAALGGKAGPHAETWEIGGRPRRMLVGPVLANADSPMTDEATTNWVDELKEILRTTEFDREMHWLRVYRHADANGEITNEATLNGSAHEELQRRLDEIHWPEPNEWYSLRLFLIVMPEQT